MLIRQKNIVYSYFTDAKRLNPSGENLILKQKFEGRFESIQSQYFAVIDVSWSYKKSERFNVVIGDWKD